MSQSKFSIKKIYGEGAASAASSVYMTGQEIKRIPWEKRLFVSRAQQEAFGEAWDKLRNEILELLKKTGKTIRIVPPKDSPEYLYYMIEKERKNENGDQ